MLTPQIVRPRTKRSAGDRNPGAVINGDFTAMRSPDTFAPAANLG
jgi:hypothetical protein